MVGLTLNTGQISLFVGIEEAHCPKSEMKTLEKNINFIVCSQAEVYVSVELPLPYAATWQAVA